MPAYDWVTNRELAALIWVFVIFTICMLWSKTQPFLRTIARCLLTPPFVTIILYAGVACFGGMLLFEPEGGWSNRLKWISIFWFFTVGLRLSFKVVELNKAQWIPVVHHVVSVFTATAIFEFIINFRSFSLVAEILIVPIVFFALHAATVKTNEITHEISALWGTAILAAVVLVCMFVSLASALSTPDVFFGAENVQSFYVPFMLSLCVSPVVVIVFVISIYQRILGSAQYAIRDENLLRYAKSEAIKNFHLNVGALERWRRLIHNGNTNTRQEVDKTISQAIRSDDVSCQIN